MRLDKYISNCGAATRSEVKKLVKNGADKKQIQEMVKMLLHLNAIPKPDDAADGLALAICHAHSNKMNKLLELNGVK